MATNTQHNDQVLALRQTILDETCPIAKRTRAAFLLRQLGTVDAIDVLVEAMGSDSILIGHEAAYVLGQMRNSYVLPHLERVLKSDSYDPVVRHEAAEAIAAIGNVDYIPLLDEWSSCDVVELAETCQIGADRLRFIKENPNWDETYKSDYHCIDPAPPLEDDVLENVKQIYLDPTQSLFQRYRAMFKLRDINTSASIKALCEGFNDPSALFRHEVAYVCGQLENPIASKALEKAMTDQQEHGMVRHEAAEALGTLADDEDIHKVLEQYQQCEERIVSESCQVALDIAEYWQTDEIETVETE